MTPRSALFFLSIALSIPIAACVADPPADIAATSDAGDDDASDDASDSSSSDGGTSDSAVGDAATGAPVMQGVSLGSFSGCALGTDGSVWCWGANTFGALALTPVTGQVRAQAKPVTGIPTMTSISAGTSHICAVSSTNDVWCWGTNQYGELGHDPTLDSACAAGVFCNATPMKVDGVKAIKVVALAFTTCALTTAGQVACWGRGDSALLGQEPDGGVPNDDTQSSTPILVPGFAPGDAKELGGSSFPGTSACAVLAGGNVKCWGGNSVGQLGHTPMTAGDMKGSPGGHCSGGCNPIPSLVPLAGGGNVTSALGVSGSFTSCAILTPSAKLQCWGGNGCGQLANAGTTADGGFADNQTGAATALSSQVLGIATANAVCAVLESHEVECWGDDRTGIVGTTTTSACLFTNDGVGGNGTATPRLQPGLRATAVSVGETAAAVVDDDGHVLAWGQNSTVAILGHQPATKGDDTAASNRNLTPTFVDGLGP